MNSLRDNILDMCFHKMQYTQYRHSFILVSSGISKEKSRYLVSKYQDRKYQQQSSCHHCTIQTSHSDSAYSSMYSNSCGRNDDTYLTSSDDNLRNELYDADDEIDGILYERTDLTIKSPATTTTTTTKTTSPITEGRTELTPTKLRSETDHLFCFSQSDLSDSNIVYSLDRAMEIIKERPKLTERLSLEDDSDDCFRESEYDVIDSDEDLNIIESDGTYSAITMPVITVRSYDSPDEGIVEIIAGCKKKERIGKVRSLPNMRFPLRKKFNVCKRTLHCHDDKLDYKFRDSIPLYNTSDSEDSASPKNHHSFPRRGRRSKNRAMLHEHETNKSHIKCVDIFPRQDEFITHPMTILKNDTRKYRSSKMVDTDEFRLGRFQICHILEHPMKIS